MQILKTLTGIRLIIPGILDSEYPVTTPSHFALTRQGDTFRVFVAGILVDTVVSAAVIPANQDPLRIGPGGFVLDELRLTNGALYTATFTPPNAPHPEGSP